MIEEIVMNNRDNSIDLLLKADGEAQSLLGVTKMILEDEDGELDDISSDDYPDYFDWAGSTTGKLILTLGSHGITAGRYILRLIVYDATHTNGIFWDRFMINVKD